MPKVWVPSPMRDVTEGRHTLDIPGATVREVLDNLVALYPQARERLLQPDGSLQPHFVLLADGTEVVSRDAPLKPDSELVITPALGGGHLAARQYPAVLPTEPSESVRRRRRKAAPPGPPDHR